MMSYRWLGVVIFGLAASNAQAFPGNAAAPLPDGRLMGLSGNEHGASFVALDQSSKQGPLADAWAMRVFAKPVVLSGPQDKNQTIVTQSFAHWHLDCGRRTSEKLSEDGFDVSGKWLIGLVPRGHIGPPERIEPNSTEDFLAKFLCEGRQPPQVSIVKGHAAAVELARMTYPGAR
jgi:hypothetical protein